jgi:predicted nuclease of predicted toxin-antitoxin system
MKLLLDECIPRKLKRSFVGHVCHTVPDAGFAGRVNGELLTAAERAGFDVLVTTDKGLEHEQNFTGRRIAVVVLLSKSNKVVDLLPLVDKCLNTLSHIKPGQVVRVGPQA